MSIQTDNDELQLRQQRAQHVYEEMLTALSPDVRQALDALYELVRADINLARCQCQTHSPH